MQLLKVQGVINFMSYRKLGMLLSLILICSSVFSLATRGINWGLDFSGGVLVEVGYPKDADLDVVRSQLESAGYPDAVVVHFGSNKDVAIRLPLITDKKSSVVGNEIVAALSANDADIEMRRIDFVGPTVGEELKEKGGLAMIMALICILIYVTFRFEWRFALGAVFALVHDVIITVGLFSMLQMDFDLTILAAILAVIGYSLNDTIVVSDRIRENFRKVREGTTAEIIDISLTQTLSRTLITSITTLLVLLALFFVGGSTIHGFSTALLAGVFIGTYSSIYVASTVALTLGISKEDLIIEVVEKEGEDQESFV